MKKILFLIIVLLMINIVLAQENKIYVVNLDFKDNQLTLKDISLQTGFTPDRKLQPTEGYKYELLSFDNKVLDAFRFEIPLLISSSIPIEDFSSTDIINLEGQHLTQLEEVNFALITKYFPNAKQINIYDPNNVKVLEIDVSRFSQQPTQPSPTLTPRQQSRQQIQIPEQYQGLTEEEILVLLQQQGPEELSSEELELLLALTEQEEESKLSTFHIMIIAVIILGIIFYIIIRKRQQPKLPSQAYQQPPPAYPPQQQYPQRQPPYPNLPGT